MTLSSWVRDYLYIPLGGNRLGVFRQMQNLFISMLIMGLWHGAGWTFVIWGGLHGVFLVINHRWRCMHIPLPRVLCWTLTFLCVVVAWVFFRAASVGEAISILHAMADVSSFALPQNAFTMQLFANHGIPFFQWQIPDSPSRVCITRIVLFAITMKLKNPIALQGKIKPSRRWLAFSVLLFVVSLYYIAKRGTGEFLYFQF